MIASYPMYCLPQMTNSLNTWWMKISEQLDSQGIKAPIELAGDQTDLINHWLNPKLFLSQTCGYPLVSILQNQVKIIGTLNYSSEFSEGPDYCSLLLVHKTNTSNSIESLQGKTFAFNETGSQSGFNAVRNYLASRSLSMPYFGEMLQSGQHVKSLAAVANQQADICAVDSVTYSLLVRYQPEKLENVRILDKTTHTPGLPLITSIETPHDLVDQIYAVIEDVCHDRSLDLLNQDLMIKGISKVPYSDYLDQINLPENPVNRL